MTPQVGATPLPGWQQVRAAARLAPALLDSTAAHARREMYRRLPTGGLLGVNDLAAGEALLVQLGLLQHAPLPGELVASPGLTVVAALPRDQAWALIARTALTDGAGPWASAAVAVPEFDYSAVPDAARRLLEGLNPDEREAALLSAARRADPEGRAGAGQRGEVLVAGTARAELEAAGRPDLAQQVQQVSLISDQLGYDVTAPTRDGRSRRLEVKTTGPAPRIHLSRTEADVGACDPAWALVVCSPSGSHEDLAVAGWCRGGDLLPLLPVDTHPRGRWADVVLALPPGLLHPGLPG